MAARNLAMPLFTFNVPSVFSMDRMVQEKVKKAMKASCRLVKPEDDGLTKEAALEVAFQNASR